jgi:hypothetical protein
LFKFIFLTLVLLAGPAVVMGTEVYAQRTPWYGRAYETKDADAEPDGGLLVETSNGLEERRREEYRGPDMSKERTLEDDLLRRDIPMPQRPVPMPPKNPPTIDQYKPPSGPNVLRVNYGENE